MCECLEQHLMGRYDNADIVQNTVPLSLSGPKLDVVPSAEDLMAKSGQVGQEDFMLLFAERNRWG